MLMATPVCASDGDTDCSQTQAVMQSATDVADSQTELGLMYLNGICVAKNNAKAKVVLSRPANQGNTKAMALLATAYHRDGQDTEAVSWARKAAEKGGGGGQSLLAWLYYLGEGAPKNLTQALKWAKRAADQGMGGGASLLGLLYENGQAGLPRDLIEADKWYILALEREKNSRALQFAKRTLEYNMPEGDRREASRRAESWSPPKKRRD
jgi:TPR repeat protein